MLVDDLNKSDVRSSPSAALSTPFLCLTLDEQTIVAHNLFSACGSGSPPPALPPLAWSCTSTHSAFAHLHCIASLASHSICKSQSALSVPAQLICIFPVVGQTYIHGRDPGRRIRRPCPLDGRFVRMIFVETLLLGFLSSKMRIPKN